MARGYRWVAWVSDSMWVRGGWRRVPDRREGGTCATDKCPPAAAYARGVMSKRPRRWTSASRPSSICTITALFLMMAAISGVSPKGGVTLMLHPALTSPFSAMSSAFVTGIAVRKSARAQNRSSFSGPTGTWALSSRLMTCRYRGGIVGNRIGSIWGIKCKVINPNTTPHHTTPHRTTPHHTASHRTAPHCSIRMKEYLLALLGPRTLLDHILNACTCVKSNWTGNSWKSQICRVLDGVRFPDPSAPTPRLLWEGQNAGGGVGVWMNPPREVSVSI